MFMMKMSRRRFLQASAATALLVSTGGAHAFVAPSLSYPRKKVANIKDLKEDQPIFFNYPDDNSPALIVKLGEEAFGGIGPNRDIVAFSSICTHKGCPMNYGKKRLICGCHYSMFDLTKNGQTYQGHASEWLPQIILRYEPRTGDIYAEGVEGLIWGRARNILAKK